MTTTTHAPPEVPCRLDCTTPVDAARGARKLGAAVLAGGLLGLLVGGVGSRLGMMLLAILNPHATGRMSDDGFRIGQLTGSGTFNLLLVGTLLGALGGLLYNVLRPLLIGPRWFRIGSISVGPAVVVGAMLIHTDGIDFRILEPAWLAIALFVAIPGLYAGLLTVLVEKWLHPAAWPVRVRLPVAAAPLLLMAPFAPVAAVVIVGWLFTRWARRLTVGRVILDNAALPWIARAGLTVIFALALDDLVRDIATLT